jgi:hypothetical protein
MSIDYQSRLTKVQAAINAILDGGVQSYTLDGRSLTKLDLGWLTREESRLEAKIARASRRRGAFRRVDPL